MQFDLTLRTVVYICCMYKKGHLIANKKNCVWQNTEKFWLGLDINQAAKNEKERKEGKFDYLSVPTLLLAALDFLFH